MKKIVAFGDSFVNYEWIDVKGHNWVDYLSNILNIPVINYGISGSGIAYALDAFVKYYHSDDYCLDDIIIFVPSSDQRLYTTNMYNPRLGSKIISMDHFKYEDIEKEWLNEHGKSALWTIMNVYDPKINYELIKTLSFLQTWAQQHLTNTMIIARAFGPLNSNIEKLNKIITPSENFFPLIEPTTTLCEISIHEYSDPPLHTLHQQYWDGIDYRINHLNPYNRMGLAKMISNLISTKSVNAIDFSWVQTNVITNTEQFKLLPTYYH